MRHIEEMVRRLVPDEVGDARLSIASLRTTDPAYLVFAEDADAPRVVVRTSGDAHIEQTHRFLERLHAEVGDLVPQPLAAEERCGRFVTVQRGVPGIPWFRLGEHYQTAPAWQSLRDRALEALFAFQDGVLRLEPAQASIDLSQELLRQLEVSRAEGVQLSSQVEQRVRDLADELAPLGRVAGLPQHGDFCLNNLLVGRERVVVIDFDDYGSTAMPLHDELSLAISMVTLSPHADRFPTLPDELDACARQGLRRHGSLTEASLPGLLMHHLLLRVGEWSSGARRADFRQKMVALIEQCASSPPFARANSR